MVLFGVWCLWLGFATPGTTTFILGIERLWVVLAGSVNVSLNARGALVYSEGNEVLLERPSIITISIGSHHILTANGRTGTVVNHAPNSVVTIGPLRSNIVTSFSVATSVLRGFVCESSGASVFAGAEIIVAIPDNMARIRHETIRSTTHTTNTRRIRLVRRPVTTTLNTKLPIFRTTNSVIISVNNNAYSITIVSLNKVTTEGDIGVTNGTLGRTVVGRVGETRGLLVNSIATRSVGVGVNSISRCSNRNTVRMENHGLASNLPGGVRVADRRVEGILARPINRVIRTVERALRIALPRLTTSVVSHKVCVANNATLLEKLPRLVSGRAGVTIRVPRGPVSIITVNASTGLEETEWGVGRLLGDGQLGIVTTVVTLLLVNTLVYTTGNENRATRSKVVNAIFAPTG